jgi:hypothetical protein
VQTWLLSQTGHLSVLDTASAYLFPGYLPVLLALAAVGWGVTRRRSAAPPDPGRWWRAGAGVLDLVAALLLAGAIALTVVGAMKLRIGSTIVFSSRSPWRPWLFFALAAALRVALTRRVPFVVAPRLRRSADVVQRWWAARRRSMLAFYTGLTLVSLWLSIGPPLGVWPLVYWLPGLNFIRVPSRFTVLAVLGLAVLAGMGFDRLAARLRPRLRTLVAVVVGFLLVGEFAAMPMATMPYRFEVPMVDRWLDGRPKPFAIAEVPSPDPSMSGAFERRQTAYMLHSTAHWQKTVHGYGGILPALHERLYREIARFPDEASLTSLTRLGVTYIVVHTELYPPGEWQDVSARIDQYEAWLRLEHVAGTGRVYSLRRPAR